MQIVVYESIIIDFDSNIEVCRLNSETRNGVEEKLNSFKDENGKTYKVITLGSIGFVGEVEEVPNDINVNIEVLKLNIP